MKKIIILGIDGLEYTLVEEWDLKYLKQKAYTKTDLSDFNVIVTPLIWAAMLTGKKVQEIEDIWLDRTKYFSQIASVTYKSKKEQVWYARFIAKILPPNIKKIAISILFKILPNPFEKTQSIIKDLSYSTVFDFYDKVWTNGIPSYGRNVSTPVIRKLMKDAIKGNIKPLVNYALKIYKEDKTKLITALKEDYQLIFWYTPFLDEIEHFFIKNKIKLLNIYLELNNLVRLIKYKFTSPDDIIYIISDHGMVPVEGDPRGGDHSDYGFFSSNTGELIKKPQDLFNLVVSKKQTIN